MVDTLIELYVNDNEMHQIALYKCLGYLCQDSEEGTLDNFSNKILNIIINRGILAQTSGLVRFAAVNALLNSLIFASKQFETQETRTYIIGAIKRMCSRDGSMRTEIDPSGNQLIQPITVIGASLQLQNEIRLKGFECLVQVGELYYECLENEAADIFTLTSEVIGEIVRVGDNQQQTFTIQQNIPNNLSVNEDIALMALTFWAVVAEKEELIQKKLRDQELGIEKDNENEDEDDDDDDSQDDVGIDLNNNDDERPRGSSDKDIPNISYHLCTRSCMQMAEITFALFPLVDGKNQTQLTSYNSQTLLSIFSPDNWNLISAAETLFGSVCKLVLCGEDLDDQDLILIGKQFLRKTVEFVQQGFQRGDWAGADSAVRTLGCLFEGVGSDSGAGILYEILGEEEKQNSIDIVGSLKDDSSLIKNIIRLANILIEPIFQLFYRIPPPLIQIQSQNQSSNPFAIQSNQQQLQSPFQSSSSTSNSPFTILQTAPFTLRFSILALLDKLAKSGCLGVLVEHLDHSIQILKTSLLFNGEEISEQQNQLQISLGNTSSMNQIPNIQTVVVQMQQEMSEEECLLLNEKACNIVTSIAEIAYDYKKNKIKQDDDDDDENNDEEENEEQPNFFSDVITNLFDPIFSGIVQPINMTEGSNGIPSLQFNVAKENSRSTIWTCLIMIAKGSPPNTFDFLWDRICQISTWGKYAIEARKNVIEQQMQNYQQQQIQEQQKQQQLSIQPFQQIQQNIGQNMNQYIPIPFLFDRSTCEYYQELYAFIGSVVLQIGNKQKEKLDQIFDFAMAGLNSIGTLHFFAKIIDSNQKQNSSSSDQQQGNVVIKTMRNGVTGILSEVLMILNSIALSDGRGFLRKGRLQQCAVQLKYCLQNMFNDEEVVKGVCSTIGSSLRKMQSADVRIQLGELSSNIEQQYSHFNEFLQAILFILENLAIHTPVIKTYTVSTNIGQQLQQGNLSQSTQPQSIFTSSSNESEINPIFYSIQNIYDFLGVIFDFVTQFESSLFHLYPRITSLVNRFACLDFSALLDVIHTQPFQQSPTPTAKLVDEMRYQAILTQSAILHVLKESIYGSNSDGKQKKDVLNEQQEQTNPATLELMKETAGSIWKADEALVAYQIGIGDKGSSDEDEEDDDQEEQIGRIGLISQKALCNLFSDFTIFFPNFISSLLDQKHIRIFAKRSALTSGKGDFEALRIAGYELVNKMKKLGIKMQKKTKKKEKVIRKRRR